MGYLALECITRQEGQDGRNTLYGASFAYQQRTGNSAAAQQSILVVKSNLAPKSANEIAWSLVAAVPANSFPSRPAKLLCTMDSTGLFTILSFDANGKPELTQFNTTKGGSRTYPTLAEDFASENQASTLFNVLQPNRQSVMHHVFASSNGTGISFSSLNTTSGMMEVIPARWNMVLQQYTWVFTHGYASLCQVRYTTRKPRAGEVDGREYNFVTREEFLAGVARKEFIEHAEFSGNLYGTSIVAVRTVGEQGKICILDIDMQGVKLVKDTDLNPWYLSLQPPSIQILEQRLRSRGTESESDIQKRLDASSAEIEYAKEEGAYDEVIVNDDLETSYAKFKAFIDKVTA
ncbi:guanylate kinase [Actinomortierella ambigua]|nr:guanylate kinase [Actinomortierella ambigua]